MEGKNAEYKILLCDKCKGYGRYFERNKPINLWRAYNEGILLDETGNAAFPSSCKLVTCPKCKGAGRERILSELKMEAKDTVGELFEMDKIGLTEWERESNNVEPSWHHRQNIVGAK